MKRVDPNIPPELAAFVRDGRALEYDPTACEAGRVTLLPLDKLVVQLFPTDVQSSAIEHDDPHRGELNLGCYMVPAVDLVQTAENYEPTGLLLWLPTERQFGTWDSSHPWIAVFDPEVTWRDIAAAPARFINAQWEGAFDDAAPTTPLVPWHRHTYRAEQFFEPERLPVEEPTALGRRLYRYVGPEDIRRRSVGKDGGDIVSNTQIVRGWATHMGQIANAVAVRVDPRLPPHRAPEEMAGAGG